MTSALDMTMTAFLNNNNNNIPRLYTAHTRRKHVKILTMFRRVIRAVYPRLNIFHTNDDTIGCAIINLSKISDIVLATLACNNLPSSLPHLPVRIKGLIFVDWRRCLVLFLHSFPFFNQPLSSSTPRPLTSDIDPRHDGFGHDF
eukprot:sb/3474008/